MHQFEKSNKVQLFVGKRQTGKSHRAVAAVLQFVAENPAEDSLVYAGGPNDEIVSYLLEAPHAYLMSRQINKLRRLTMEYAEEGQLPYLANLKELAASSTRLCFYLISVHVSQLPELIELTEAYPQHEWLIEIWTNNTDSAAGE